MSQPPANPYPSQPDNGAPYGSYPPPQQQPGGYPSPAQPTGFPAQPGQPYGDQSGAPQKKKSNVGKIVLISLAVVLVLCLGGAAIAFFAVKDEVKEGVEAINTRVVAPDTLAGRAKSTDPALTEGAKELEAQLNKSLPDATSTAGAFYGTPAKKDLVMIAAASGLNADPEKTLEDTITGAAQSDVKIAQMKTVDAGPLGGVAKCGDAKAANVPLGVCVWSDRGSLGMIIVYFKSGQEAAAELPAMRAAIEQKN
ncbi:hypothetical protein [Micromonospora coxensis]|uniref:hypothetical protein n=1 Tax=Micromonospora coxensis TaxID=356852 RepID=UPI0034431B02